MKRALGRAAAIGAFLLAQVTLVSAAELKVYCGNPLKEALQELAPDFEKASGNKLSFTWGIPSALVKQIEAGETADVYIVTRRGLGTLVKDGKASITHGAGITTSVLGLGIKKGSKKPDISTAETFKQTLLKAKSIAYSDPAFGGIASVYFSKLLERMGIAEQMKSKTKLASSDDLLGKLNHYIASGEAEFIVLPVPELLPMSGVDLVGPLPAKLNLRTTFAAGIGVESKEKTAAKALIKFLHSKEAQAVFKAKGLHPV